MSRAHVSLTVSQLLWPRSTEGCHEGEVLVLVAEYVRLDFWIGDDAQHEVFQDLFLVGDISLTLGALDGVFAYDSLPTDVRPIAADRFVTALVHAIYHQQSYRNIFISRNKLPNCSKYLLEGFPGQSSMEAGHNLT